MPRKLASIIAALIAAALAPAPAQAGSFSAIYAFGDSLSDVGNALAVTGFPASPPYYNGRASNGPNWVDKLSASLGLVGPVLPSLLPAIPSPPISGNDWAWASATTGATGTLNPAPAVPTGLQQVGAFLATHGAAPSGGLYTFTLGSNDLLNILEGISSPTGVADAALAEAQAIGALATAGAKTFIVALVPDLGKVPLIHALAPGDQAAWDYASSLANTYNQALRSDLVGIAGVHVLDTFAWLDNAEKHPGQYGLINVADPCYSGAKVGAPGGTVCGSPDTFLFWDQLHPTTVVDGFLARDAVALLAPSPTPGAGLASLGLLLLVGIRWKRA